MTTLEQKLNKILIYFEKLIEERGSALNIDNKAVIEAILEAVKEAGWHEPLSSERLARDVLRTQYPLMTGQEWFDRFEKTLNKSYRDYDYHYEDTILEIARKVANKL